MRYRSNGEKLYLVISDRCLCPPETTGRLLQSVELRFGWLKTKSDLHRGPSATLKKALARQYRTLDFSTESAASGASPKLWILMERPVLFEQPVTLLPLLAVQYASLALK